MEDVIAMGEREESGGIGWNWGVRGGALGHRSGCVCFVSGDGDVTRGPCGVTGRDACRCAGIGQTGARFRGTHLASFAGCPGQSLSQSQLVVVVAVTCGSESGPPAEHSFVGEFGLACMASRGGSCGGVLVWWCRFHLVVPRAVRCSPRCCNRFPSYQHLTDWRIGPWRTGGVNDFPWTRRRTWINLGESCL